MATTKPTTPPETPPAAAQVEAAPADALTTDQRSAAAQRRAAAAAGGGVDSDTRRRLDLDALAEERRGYVQRAAGATGEVRARLEDRIAQVDAAVARLDG